MRWVLAFHLIFMVAWFAGLFYLPRIFVYHADTQDSIGEARFRVMERRLLHAITTPAGILTTVLGVVLFRAHPELYLHAFWMHIKLISVLLLWIFHILCARMVSDFSKNKNQFSSVFYRYFNEVPTVLLVVIILMTILQPTL